MSIEDLAKRLDEAGVRVQVDPDQLRATLLTAHAHLDELRKRVAELERIIGERAIEALEGPVWKAGYAACEADVVAWLVEYAKEHDRVLIDVHMSFANGQHRGAAARKAGGNE